MPSKLALAIQHPIQAVVFFYGFLVRVLIVLGSRILLPNAPRYQSLRTELQRAYLTSTSLNFPDLTFCLPAAYPESQAFPIQGSGWKGWLIPGGKDALSTLERAAKQDDHRVVIYAHGGGYARGTARMYTPYMHRWAGGATGHGIKLIFLSLEYSKTLNDGQSRSILLTCQLRSSEYASASSKATAGVSCSVQIPTANGYPTIQDLVHGRLSRWRHLNQFRNTSDERWTTTACRLNPDITVG